MQIDIQLLPVGRFLKCRLLHDHGMDMIKTNGGKMRAEHFFCLFGDAKDFDYFQMR